MPLVCHEFFICFNVLNYAVFDSLVENKKHKSRHIAIEQKPLNPPSNLSLFCCKHLSNLPGLLSLSYLYTGVSPGPDLTVQLNGTAGSQGMCLINLTTYSGWLDVFRSGCTTLCFS